MNELFSCMHKIDMCETELSQKFVFVKQRLKMAQAGGLKRSNFINQRDFICNIGQNTITWSTICNLVFINYRCFS